MGSPSRRVTLALFLTEWRYALDSVSYYLWPLRAKLFRSHGSGNIGATGDPGCRLRGIGHTHLEAASVPELLAAGQASPDAVRDTTGR